MAKRKSRFTYKMVIRVEWHHANHRQPCNYIFITWQVSSNFTTAVIETFWDSKIWISNLTKKFGSAVNRENRFTTPVCRCRNISDVVLPHDISLRKKCIISITDQYKRYTHYEMLIKTSWKVCMSLWFTFYSHWTIVNGFRSCTQLQERSNSQNSQGTTTTKLHPQSTNETWTFSPSLP
jgi:hypothetical protein